MNRQSLSAVGLFAIVALLLGSRSARADVMLPSILSSEMVLQQGMDVPVWGWADAGEKVTVSFAGQTKSTEAGDDGKWLVKLDKLTANAKGATLTIKGNNTIKLTDVLVGEVWICSGQSNMEWSVTRSANPKEETAAANHPKIRLFNVPGHETSPTELEKLKRISSWTTCSPKSVAGFSAVGYYFGRALQKKLDVPIGLVGSNWGGTKIEPWTTLDGFNSVPELKQLAERSKKQAETNAKVGGGSPSAICNAMVLPLAPYAMRGAIWYQGESNGGEGMSYYHKKKGLVNGWRKLFNEDLGFYWVQLANFRAANDKPEGGDGWARIREAQRHAAKDIPHAGMAVIIDIGEARDIHPKNKQDVGKRLANYALHQTYKLKDVVPAGPLYTGHKVEGNKIRLSFDYVGGGLMVGKKQGLKPTEQDKEGKLARFAIAGEDKVWHWANAEIDGDTVIVSSDQVAKPVAVRYAYSMNPAGANLYNKEGMPASPFRTDEW